MKPIGERIIIKRLHEVSMITGEELDDSSKRGEVVSGDLKGKIIYYREADHLKDDLYSVDLTDVLAEE